MANTKAKIGLTLILALACAGAFADTQQWPAAKANAWYAKQRWLVGSNYVPTDAINQLEMWQADTWNPRRSTRSWAGRRASA